MPAVLPRLRALIVVVLLVALSGCGEAPPTAEQAAPTSAEQQADNPYESVFAELEGLTGQERRDRLVELAGEEDAELQAYGSNTDLADLAAAFTEQYGIPVEVYRARTQEVLQRVLEEAEAGQLQADLFDNNGYEMGIIADHGLTVDYEGAVQDQLREGTDWDGWTANRFTITSPVWNTDVIQDPPTEFADMADPRFAEELIIEPTAFDWYMTLSSWFQDQGMTEEEFDEMFLGIVRNSTVLQGNTNQVQFLASGEYGISAGTFNHLIDEAIASGAPLERLPAVGPIIARPNGMGLARRTEYPASTLLFFEWLLTDAQPTLVEEYRLPALDGIETDLLEGIDELITIDVERLVSEGQEWEERYELLLREAAGTAEAPDGG